MNTSPSKIDPYYSYYFYLLLLFPLVLPLSYLLIRKNMHASKVYAVTELITKS